MSHPRWQRGLARRGFHTSALQVAKHLTGDAETNRRPALAVRIESSDPPADAEQMALEVVHSDPKIAYAVARGILPVPRIEIFAPGTLLKGRFKLPIFVDETGLSG